MDAVNLSSSMWSCSSSDAWTEISKFTSLVRGDSGGVLLEFRLSGGIDFLSSLRDLSLSSRAYITDLVVSDDLLSEGGFSMSLELGRVD